MRGAVGPKFFPVIGDSPRLILKAYMSKQDEANREAYRIYDEHIDDGNLRDQIADALCRWFAAGREAGKQEEREWVLGIVERMITRELREPDYWINRAEKAERKLAECEQERDTALGLLPGKLKGAQALADEKSRCFYERAIAAERKLAEHPRIIAGRYCCCCGKVVVTETGEGEK